MVAVDWGNMDVVRYFLKERKISEAEGGVDHVFQAAKLAASHWKRLLILLFIVEEVLAVMNIKDADGKMLVDFAVDAGNMKAVIGLSSVLLLGGNNGKLNTITSWSDATISTKLHYYSLRHKSLGGARSAPPCLLTSVSTSPACVTINGTWVYSGRNLVF